MWLFTIGKKKTPWGALMLLGVYYLLFFFFSFPFNISF
jgi:hypothetical protein